MSDSFVVTLVDSSGSSRDIRLTIETTVTGKLLFQALGDRLPAGVGGVWCERTGETFSRESAQAIDVRHGDRLAVTPLAAHDPSRLERIDGSEVHTVAGDVEIGRRVDGPGSIQLDDQTVSGIHARIVFEGSVPSIEDANSTNGTFVNGERISERRRLHDGDVLDLGDSSRYVFRGDASGAFSPPASGFDVSSGRVSINRPPRRVVPSPARTTRVPPAPPTRRRRRFPWASLVIPVVGGCMMALVLGNLRFLAFAAMGPAMAIWNFFDSRTSDARQHSEAVEQYEQALRDLQQQLSASAVAETAWYESVLPGPGLIAKRVQTSVELWDRQPDHEDFGWLRVGTGPIPPLHVVEVDAKGDPALVEMAVSLSDEYSARHIGPHRVALLSEPAIGIVGRGSAVDGAVASLILQAASRHSPREFALCLLSTSPSFEWMRWLPHCEAVPGLDVSPPVVDADGCRKRLDAVNTLIDRRLAGDMRAIGGAAIPLPHITVIVAPPSPIPPAEIATLIDRGSMAGVSVLFVAPTAAALPSACRAVLDLDGTPALGRPGLGTTSELEDVDSVARVDAERQARQLAGYLDSSAAAGSAAIPKAVSLLDANGLDATITRSDVEQRWSTASNQLICPIGSVGDQWIDLSFASTREGPHILVAGTTRAGKSEFLQALVAGLALHHPPDQLNMLYVDWKGAATFRPFLSIPHSVGLLSDLDEGLADRALRSMQAELTFRKRLLDARGVQKFEDLEPGVLPRLVVLFDEFAELVDSNKEFSDGVITVAQVGGSLGVHMVLAMQTPSAAINKRVDNCINGKIVFRLKDKSESSSALGSPLAAEISSAIPGRGYLKDGSNRLIEFQSAYGGMVTSTAADIEVSGLTVGAEVLAAVRDDAMATDLERIVAVIEDAVPTDFKARPPWVDPLPTLVSLDELPQTEVGAAIGIVDDPDAQKTRPYSVDLDTVRNLLITGSGGTGRTSALRSVVDALARSWTVNELVVYGVDMAGDFRSASCVPHVADVVPGDDPDRLRRLMTIVQRELERRRSAQESSGGPAVQSPRVVLAIDGLTGLLAELAELDHQTWHGSLQSVMADGPSLGIHVVAATEDPTLRSAVMNLFNERLVLRQAMKEGYSHLGVANIPVTSTKPGRAISAALRLEVQLALAADPGVHEGTGQVDAMRRRWSGARSAFGPIEALGEVLDPARVQHVSGGPAQVAIGLDDVTHEPLVLDFATQPSLLVAGPDLSGRTSTVAWIREAMRSAGETQAVRLLMSAGSAADSGWDREARGPAEILEYLQQLLETEATGATLLAFDDADLLLDNTPAATPEAREARKVIDDTLVSLEALLDVARERSLVIVVAGRLDDLGRARGALKRMRDAKQAVILSPTNLGTSTTDPLFGVKLPRRTGYVPRAGAGVLIRRTDVRGVQVPFAAER